jgi:hypothetical protein
MASKVRLWGWLAGFVALATALAVPAGSAAGTNLLGACAPASYTHPFTPWLDLDSYALAPNGGFEAGSTGWTLTGGAKVVSGNETYRVNGASDAASLALPAGSSATSSAVCVDPTSPTLRLFVRNSGSLLSTLRVDVLYTDLFGVQRTVTVATLLGGSTWQPSLPVAFLVNLTALPLVTNGTTPVAVRFTPQGAAGGWAIDDVYVDPFKGN